ncbi:MAG TPA: hypothetical protein VFA91_04910 [Candidatus Polarisedimenticolia bacterium]|nr:hypothetical protein [Candidatus Polarisedimenticolia bacterium]
MAKAQGAAIWRWLLFFAFVAILLGAFLLAALYAGIWFAVGFVVGAAVVHLQVRMTYGFWIDAPGSARHRLIEALVRRPEYRDASRFTAGASGMRRKG